MEVQQRDCACVVQLRTAPRGHHTYSQHRFSDNAREAGMLPCTMDSTPNAAVLASQVQRAVQPARRRRVTVAMAGPQPLFQTAFVMPGLAVTLFRAATAGVGVYCLLQWRTFHNTRKQVCSLSCCVQDVSAAADGSAEFECTARRGRQNADCTCIPCAAVHDQLLDHAKRSSALYAFWTI